MRLVSVVISLLWLCSCSSIPNQVSVPVSIVSSYTVPESLVHDPAILTRCSVTKALTTKLTWNFLSKKVDGWNIGCINCEGKRHFSGDHDFEPTKIFGEIRTSKLKEIRINFEKSKGATKITKHYGIKPDCAVRLLGKTIQNSGQELSYFSSGMKLTTTQPENFYLVKCDNESHLDYVFLDWVFKSNDNKYLTLSVDGTERTIFSLGRNKKNESKARLKIRKNDNQVRVYLYNKVDGIGYDKSYLVDKECNVQLKLHRVSIPSKEYL